MALEWTLKLTDAIAPEARPTAAQHLAALRRIEWHYDVATSEQRCVDCRSWLPPGTPFVSEYDGVVGELRCLGCMPGALERHRALVADLEWRAEREEGGESDEALAPAVSMRIVNSMTWDQPDTASIVERVHKAMQEALSAMPPFTGRVTIDGEPLPTPPATAEPPTPQDDTPPKVLSAAARAHICHTFVQEGGRAEDFDGWLAERGWR